MGMEDAPGRLTPSDAAEDAEARALARFCRHLTEALPLPMAAVPGLRDLDLKRMEREVARELEQFTGLLRGEIPRARQALKRPLSDRVEFRPVDLGNGKRTYAFRGELTYGAILQGVSLEKTLWGSEPAVRINAAGS